MRGGLEKEEVVKGLGYLGLSGALAALVFPSGICKDPKLMGVLAAGSGATALAAAFFLHKLNAHSCLPASLLLPFATVHFFYAALLFATKPPKDL